MRLIRRRTPTLDTGGQQARMRAEAELERVRAETEKYAALAEELRKIGVRNNLALAFMLAARGRHPR